MIKLQLTTVVTLFLAAATLCHATPNYDQNLNSHQQYQHEILTQLDEMDTPGFARAKRSISENVFEKSISLYDNLVDGNDKYSNENDRASLDDVRTSMDDVMIDSDHNASSINNDVSMTENDLTTSLNDVTTTNDDVTTDSSSEYSPGLGRAKRSLFYRRCYCVCPGQDGGCPCGRGRCW